MTHFESIKEPALLAYLAAESDLPQRREALVELLWPERPEASARANLRHTLANLRRAIGDRVGAQARPHLLVDRETVQFSRASDVWVDIQEFERQLRAVHELHLLVEPEACNSQCGTRALTLAQPPQLEACVSLYRGSFLEGFSLPDSAAYEEWVLVMRERWQRRVMEVLQRLSAHWEQQGDYARALQHARRQVELEQWDEAAQRAVMRLLALSGQRSGALAQYEVCVRALAQQLGVEPSLETTALYRRIREERLDREPGSAYVTSTQPESAALPTLPIWVTPFVGRTALLAEIGERLRNPTCRLLTLVGPGGSGKTRLAVEAVVRLSDHWPHGVHFVSLASLESVASIVPTVAQALGFSFRRGGDPHQQLLEYLRPRRMLLLLDNCEHLFARHSLACGDTEPQESLSQDHVAHVSANIVADILQAAPGLQILATSRAVLDIAGEQLLPVPGMEYPALSLAPGSFPRRRRESSDAEISAVSQHSAVQLFLQAAQRVRPGYQPMSEELAQVVELCHLAKGMPLALLLAAAWMRVLDPGEIVAELRRSLDLLETDQRDVPERQRSVRATFDHSRRLLDEREQQVLAALAIFRGGCTRAAALEVTGVTLRMLKRLVSQSLVEHTPEGRYELHELLRQYAQERLHQSPEVERQVRDRHSAYYSAALECWATELKGPRQRTALAELDAEIGNARAAWDWAVEGRHVELLDRAMDGLGRFLDWRGRTEEGESAFSAAVRMLTADMAYERRMRARALAWQAHFGYWQRGPEPLVRQQVEQSLALLDELASAGQDVRRERAFALQELGMLSRFSGIEGLRGPCQESLTLYRELDDPHGTAAVLSLLAVAAYDAGDLQVAKRSWEESVALYRRAGDPLNIVGTLSCVAIACSCVGQFAEAESLIRELDAAALECGDPIALQSVASAKAGVYVDTGRFAEYIDVMESDILPYLENQGDRPGLAVQLSWMPNMRMALGEYEQARAEAERAIALAQEVGNRTSARVASHYLAGLALVEGTFDDARRRYEEQLAFDRDSGVHFMSHLAWGQLAVAELRLGHPDLARQRLCEALRQVSDLPGFTREIEALPPVALYLANMGQPERAVEVYALARTSPSIANSHWYQDVFGKRIAAAAATLPPEVVDAAQERGRARDLWTTVEELAVELGGDRVFGSGRPG